MSARLIWAIISTLLEEAAIVAIVLWGLPYLGIHHFPLAGLIALMVAWGAYSVITYRRGSRALRKRPLAGLPDMVGSQGEVVSPLAPEGLVRIKGELWQTESASGRMDTGEEVTVVGQDGLKLMVRKRSTSDDLEKTG
jgi:membrane-bound serine protease (ClpP class)